MSYGGSKPPPYIFLAILFCVCPLTGQGKQKIRDGSVSKNSAALYFGFRFRSRERFSSCPFLLPKGADDGEDNADEHGPDPDAQQRAGQEVLHRRAADGV